MLCFGDVCFSYETLSPESVFSPLNCEQVNQIGELEAYILMELLREDKQNGINLLEQAKTGQQIQDIVIKRPYDQTMELIIAYDLQKIQEESKSLPYGYYIIPSTYNNIKYYHFIKFSDKKFDIATFTEQEYSRLNKNLLKSLVPLPERKEDKRIKDKRKHEIEIDSVIWEKAKQGNLEIIQNNASIIEELLTLINSLGIEDLEKEIQTLIKRKQFFLITGNIENLSFVGHVSDRGIYLVKGKGDNLPVLFWEIMKFRGLKQEQELGVRTQVLQWQKNKNHKPTIETLKNYLAKNTRKTSLREYPRRAYWGTENHEQQLLLQLSEVLGDIEESHRLVKIRKKINAIEKELDEQSKRQKMFNPEDTIILQPYVDVLVTIQRSSNKLQKVNLSQQDIFTSYFDEADRVLQVKQTVAQLFNSNGKSPKNNYRSFVNKFHPDKIAQLRESVSTNIQGNVSIEESFGQIYVFIISAWEFHSKQNGNADEFTENLLKRAMDLGEMPATLQKTFDLTKVIKTVNRNIKRLEIKRTMLEQSAEHNSSPEKTLQNLEHKKKQILETFGTIDKKSCEHKKKVVTAKYLKTLETVEMEKEETVKCADQIFIDQKEQIKEEKVKNNSVFEKQLILERNKKEAAIKDAEDVYNKERKKIEARKKTAIKNVEYTYGNIYGQKEATIKDAKDVYSKEWRKIEARKETAIKDVEYTYSNIYGQKEAAIKAAESVYSKEWRKIEARKEAAIKIAKNTYGNIYRQKEAEIKVEEDAYVKKWTKIKAQKMDAIKAVEDTYSNIYAKKEADIKGAEDVYNEEWEKKVNVITSARNAYDKEWRKIDDQKEAAIEAEEEAYDKEWGKRKKAIISAKDAYDKEWRKIDAQKEVAIKAAKDVYNKEWRKIKAKKDDVIKIAEDVYSKIYRQKEAAIKDAEDVYNEEWEKMEAAIKAVEDVYDKEWRKIDAQKKAGIKVAKGVYKKEWKKRETAIKTAKNIYDKEWRKIETQKESEIKDAEYIYSSSYGQKEAEIKNAENICSEERSKIHAQKESEIKAAGTAYSNSCGQKEREIKAAKDVYNKERKKRKSQKEVEIKVAKEKCSEFRFSHTKAKNELDEKLEQAKIRKQNEIKAAENKLKKEKKKARFERDAMMKTIRQLLKTDHFVALSEEPASSAKGSAKYAIDTLFAHCVFFRNREFSLYEFQSKRLLSVKERERRAAKQGVTLDQIAKVYSKTTVWKELEILQTIGILAYAGKDGKQNLYKLTESGTRLLRNPVNLKAVIEIPELDQYDIYGRSTRERIEKLTVLKHKVGMCLISEVAPQPIIVAQKTLIHVICKDLVKDFRDDLGTIFTTDLLKIARKNNRDNKIKEKIEFVSKHELLARVSILTMNPNNIVDVALSDTTFIEKLPENVKSLVFETDPSSNFINIHGVLSALRALQNNDIMTLTEIYKILTGQEFNQMEKLRKLDQNSSKYYQELAKLIIFQLPPVKVYDTAELKKMNTQMMRFLEAA